MLRQSGKSMAEIICVLAIICLLSLGTLSMIRYLITRHQANMILEDVKLAGFVLESERWNTLNLEVRTPLAGLVNMQTNYIFSAYKETESTFVIIVESVDLALCEEIKSRKVQWLEEIKANGLSDDCQGTQENVIYFYFNTDFTGDTQMQSKDCRTDKDCWEEKPYCRSGNCERCPDGQLFARSQCYDCELTMGHPFTSVEECRLCGDEYYFAPYTWDGPNNVCFGCYRYQSVTAPREECLRCSNRYYEEESQKCVMCPSGQFTNSEGNGCED